MLTTAATDWEKWTAIGTFVLAGAAWLALLSLLGNRGVSGRRRRVRPRPGPTDLKMLARLSQALSRARAVPLAA